MFHLLKVSATLLGLIALTPSAVASYKIDHSQDKALCEQVLKHFEDKPAAIEYGEYNSPSIQWIKGEHVEQELIREKSFFDKKLRSIVLGESPSGEKWHYKPYDVEYIVIPVDGQNFGLYKFKSLDPKYSDFCRYLPDDLNSQNLKPSFFEVYKNHYIYTKHCSFFSKGHRTFHVEFMRHLQLQISVRELIYDVSDKELISHHKCTLLVE